MRKFIPIHLAVEDALSEAVLRQIVEQCRPDFAIGSCFRRGGYGYLKRTINGFNQAARNLPFLVLTDLDQAECPLAIITEWLSHPKHPNLIFRIAVREIEAWLLAHRDAFADFLGIKAELIPSDVEAEDDPKRLLIELARKSRNRTLREALVPPRKSTAQVGPDYNGRLISFVEQNWKAKMAEPNAPSLRRAIAAISAFQPIWRE